MFNKRPFKVTIFVAVAVCTVIYTVFIYASIYVPAKGIILYIFQSEIDNKPESKLVDFLVTADRLKELAHKRSRIHEQPDSLIGSALWYRRDEASRFSKLHGHLVFADCTFPPTTPSIKMTAEERRRRFLSVDQFLESHFYEQHRPLLRSAIERGSGRVVEINLVPQEESVSGIEFYVRYSDSMCVRYFEPTEPAEPLEVVSKVGVPIQDYPRWRLYHSNKFAGFRLGIVQPNGLKAPHSIF